MTRPGTGAILGALLLVGGVLAGCSAPPADGTLSGSLSLGGNVPSFLDHGAEVEVEAGRVVVAHRVVRSGGAFAFTLPPGGYVLQLARVGCAAKVAVRPARHTARPVDCFWHGASAVSFPQATGANVPALSALRQTAREQAHAEGDPGAHAAVVVRTTRDAAASPDIVYSDQPVYFVVLHGDFTCGPCSRPPGASAPAGTMLSFATDLSGRMILDFGIGRQVPDVAALGRVYAFSW
jgi:hypothetical protein